MIQYIPAKIHEIMTESIKKMKWMSGRKYLEMAEYWQWRKTKEQEVRSVSQEAPTIQRILFTVPSFLHKNVYCYILIVICNKILHLFSCNKKEAGCIFQLLFMFHLLL
jgi:hypothetical protein